MKYNYHTHTVRCMHAEGTERQYIETAIERGLKELGFSDHAPYLFDGGYVSNFRMPPEQMEDYAITVRRLAEEYKDDIRIMMGLEMEFYPRYFNRTVEWLKSFQPDYLLLGQHITGNEPDGQPSGWETTDPRILRAYTDQMIEAMDTGLFTYIAHPDILNFHGDECVYRDECLRLCDYAARKKIPVEFNLLGMVSGRDYPCDTMMKAAGECGCDIILGCDAHSPDRVAVKNEIEIGKKRLESLGITPIERPEKMIALQ